MLKIGIYASTKKLSYDILYKISQESEYCFVTTKYGSKLVNGIEYYIVDEKSRGLKLDQIIISSDKYDLGLIDSLIGDSNVPYQFAIIRAEELL